MYLVEAYCLVGQTDNALKRFKFEGLWDQVDTVAHNQIIGTPVEMIQKKALVSLNMAVVNLMIGNTKVCQQQLENSLKTLNIDLNEIDLNN
jgi:hypothetical protein